MLLSVTVFASSVPYLSVDSEPLADILIPESVLRKWYMYAGLYDKYKGFTFRQWFNRLIYAQDSETDSGETLFDFATKKMGKPPELDDGRGVCEI